MRRLFRASFLTVLGLGTGLAVGAILMRRVDRAAAQMKPANMADRLTRNAAELGARVRGAMSEAAAAAQARESELRREFDVPTVGEAVGLRQRPASTRPGR